MAQTKESVIPKISEMDLDFLISYSVYLLNYIIGLVAVIYKQSNNKYKTLLQNQFD